MPIQTVADAVRCDDRSAASPTRCVEIASASASASPSTAPSRRKTASTANDRAVNRAAVRRYRERKRTDERERLEECERLREENTTLRLRLETLRAELKHSRWLLHVVAWKYDLDLADIPTEKPATSTMPPEPVSACASDANIVFPAVGVRSDVARTFEVHGKGKCEARPRKVPRTDDSRPTAALDELELKQFLEEYFTHGEACPCYESGDARAATPSGANKRHLLF